MSFYSLDFSIQNFQFNNLQESRPFIPAIQNLFLQSVFKIYFTPFVIFFVVPNIIFEQLLSLSIWYIFYQLN